MSTLINLPMSREQLIQLRVEEEAFAGSRCVICGALISKTPSLADRECDKHDEEERRLAVVAVKLRDELREKLLANEHKNNPSLHQELEGPKNRLAEALIFKRQCLRSLYYLDQSCEEAFIKNAENTDVYKVYEMEFAAKSPFDFYHNVFLISMTNGNLYVFDPTGVQFGASWPLIQRLEKYLEFRWKVDSKVRVDNLFSYGDYLDHGVKPVGEEF